MAISVRISRKFQTVVVTVIVAIIVVSGGLLITRQASLFGEPNNEIFRISQEYPGLASLDFSTFITASEAYAPATERAGAWQSDAVFNYITTPSRYLTWEGTSPEWDVVFSSPLAKKTLHIVVGKSGVLRLYEGVGKDSSGYVQSVARDHITPDSPNVLITLQKDRRVQEYIKNNLGLVNPLFALYEREELFAGGDVPIEYMDVAKNHETIELFWRVVLRPANSSSNTLVVWMDGVSGTIIEIE